MEWDLLILYLLKLYHLTTLYTLALKYFCELQTAEHTETVVTKFKVKTPHLYGGNKDFPVEPTSAG
jgi:hypothetical protein